jgi:hypothetical protein
MVKPVAATAKPHRGATPAVAPVEVDLAATEAAWTKHEHRFRALSRAEVGPASLDVTQAASVAIAATKNLLARRDELKTLYCDPPIARFEGVIELALAVQHADLLHRVSQDKTALFADIFPRMTELRGLLLDDLDIQVKRKQCSAKFVADLRLGDRDAADFANDLNDAAAWYAARLGDLPRTTISPDEVSEARSLAATALARLAVQHVADARKTDALSTSELRARGFTVLAREYDVVRQYGAPIFWSAPDGWEQYLPSLWVGRAEGTPKAPTTPVAPKPPTG